MHDQAQHDGSPMVDGSAGLETRPQPAPEIEAAEQRLEQQKAGERGQPLLLESEGRNRVGLAVDIGSAKLHFKRLSVVDGLRLRQPNPTNSEAAFPFQRTRPGSHQRWNPGLSIRAAKTAWPTGDLGVLRGFLMQLAGIVA